MMEHKIYSTLNDSGNGQGDYIKTVKDWDAVEDYCSRTTGHFYIVSPGDIISMLSYRSRFQWLIEREGITMYRLAARTGIAESTIQRYAYDTTNALKMPLENAYKIAEALEMTTDALYEELK